MQIAVLEYTRTYILQDSKSKETRKDDATPRPSSRETQPPGPDASAATQSTRESRVPLIASARTPVRRRSDSQPFTEPTVSTQSETESQTPRCVTDHMLGFVFVYVLSLNPPYARSLVFDPTFMCLSTTAFADASACVSPCVMLCHRCSSSRAIPTVSSSSVSCCA